MNKVSSLGLLGLAALAALSCKGANADVSLSKKSVESDVDPGMFTHMDVAEGATRLTAKQAGVPVFERPSKSSPRIGTLATGSSIARSDKTVRKTDLCPEGYFAVRPRGFVCADETIDPQAKPSALPDADSDRALPYRYAVLRTVSPLYARVPSPEEQLANEPNLAQHLAKTAKAEPKSLTVGANDVGLDERGVARGPAMLTKSSVGVDANGKRTARSFFESPLLAQPPAERPDAPPVARTLRKGSGLAIVASVDLPGPNGSRRFGVTPESNLIPLDRVDPALGSTWHGVDLTKEKGLPLGFVLRHEVAPYALSKGKAERLEDDEVDRRSHVHLSGRFRTVEQVRYEETEDGVWFRDRDLIKVVKRNKFPDFVSDGGKWIDVSLALQTMTLYEGRKPIYTTLISSGREVLGPKDAPADAQAATTVQGTFTITSKANTITLDPREVNEAFEVEHAPCAMQFAPGYSLVGSYLSDSVGEAKQFHNIALTPIDARRLFTWAGPAVPTGFSEIVPLAEETITVHVRK
jgi:hypothetical protein